MASFSRSADQNCSKDIRSDIGRRSFQLLLDGRKLDEAHALGGVTVEYTCSTLRAHGSFALHATTWGPLLLVKVIPRS